ncbi:MAG: hypothetical protein M3135_00725 [Actinomycetota bacterium]|nr:hypothetical protein [Actinomycetota bacterium]
MEGPTDEDLLNEKRLITSPRIRLGPALFHGPFADGPAEDPSSSTTGTPAMPGGCVDPSMFTESVMSGRGLLGLIVVEPVGRAKAIVSRTEIAFACGMAVRRVHSPVPSSQKKSDVLESPPSPGESTVNVFPDAGEAISDRGAEDLPKGPGIYPLGAALSAALVTPARCSP